MKNFTIEEMCHTNSGLPNNPGPTEKANIEFLVDNLLDKVRDLYGKPIKVNSGFRSNAANLAAGGAINSQHLTGSAADITGGSKKENEKIFEIIRGIGKFDQLINEKDFSWIHVSLKKSNNRKQILKL